MSRNYQTTFASKQDLQVSRAQPTSNAKILLSIWPEELGMMFRKR